MKLINEETGREVLKNSEGKYILVFKQGVNKGRTFGAAELEAPSESNPYGLVKSEKQGLGQEQYFPYIFGVRIEERKQS